MVTLRLGKVSRVRIAEVHRSADHFSATRTAGAEAATIGQVDVLVERGGEDRGAFLDLKATATGAQRHNKTHPILSIYRCLIRSEEHTSELQSLMRISYAVFCLKKKTT